MALLFAVGLFFSIGFMCGSSTSDGKLTKFVANHPLGNLYGNKSLTIVYSETVVDEMRQHH